MHSFAFIFASLAVLAAVSHLLQFFRQVLVRKTEQRRAEIWQNLALSLEMDLFSSEKDGHKNFSIFGKLRNSWLHISSKWEAKEANFLLTFVTVLPHPLPRNLKISISAETIADTFRKLFNIQDIIVGDINFDYRFLVQGTGAAAVKTVFDKSIRKNMVRMAEDSFGILRIGNLDTVADLIPSDIKDLVLSAGTENDPGQPGLIVYVEKVREEKYEKIFDIISLLKNLSEKLAYEFSRH